LDYSADQEQLGKNIGDDLAEGKPTLPLILAMQMCSKEENDMIRNAIEQGGLEHLQEITLAIRESGALKKTMEQAEQETFKAKAALELLSETPYKKALESLANLSVNRTS